MSAVLSQRHGFDAAVRQRANVQVSRPRLSRIGQASTVSVCLLVIVFLAIRLWRMPLSCSSPSALSVAGSLATPPSAGVRPSASSRGVEPR